MAGVSRLVTAGPGYDNKPVARVVGPRCQGAMRSRGAVQQAGSASFNSEAAAVGIRGTAGAVGTPGAEGIVDGIRRERRDETGQSRLSGLFGLSCWPDRQINQRNQRDQTDRIDLTDEQDSCSACRDSSPAGHTAEAHRWRMDSSLTDYRMSNKDSRPLCFPPRLRYRPCAAPLSRRTSQDVPCKVRRRFF